MSGDRLMLGGDFDLIEGFPAVDLQDGTNTGDWVNVKNFSRIGVLFVSGVGTDEDDPTLTIQQALTNGGGTTQALNFTVIYTKQAATSLAGVAAWTRTTQSSANTFTVADSAQESLMWYVEFDSSDLDVADGYDHIRATVNNIGSNAQPGYMMYIGKPMVPLAPANVISAL